MKTKHYQNGTVHIGAHHTEARQILIDKGIYRTLSNMGPYLTTKQVNKYNVLVDQYVIGGYEYSIIEYEYMDFDMSTVRVSAPRIGYTAWYQPITVPTDC